MIQFAEWLFPGILKASLGLSVAALSIAFLARMLKLRSPVLSNVLGRSFSRKDYYCFRS